MSAFLCVFSRKGQAVPQDCFETVEAHLLWMGPDGLAGFRDERFVTVYAHHATTPEALDEKQPLIDQCAGLCVVGNIRLDNREELTTRLRRALPKDKTITDSLLVLEAYKRWGKSSFEKLYGDFALVIWDRVGGQVICARDCFGVRPFYYALTDQWLVAASDLRLLRDCSLIETPLTGVSMRGEYKLSYTRFKGVRKLPQAHWLAASERSVKSERFWEPSRRSSRCGTVVEWREHLEALLQKAVERRIQTPLSVGAHLSGGIDSSLVSSVAHGLLQQKGRNLLAFSACPPPEVDLVLEDERHYSEMVASHLSLNCHYCSLQSIELEHIEALALCQMTEHGEIPIWDRARELDAGVMLTGLGGDEAFTYDGRGALLELLRQGRIRSVWKSLKARQNPIQALRGELILRHQRMRRSKHHLQNATVQRCRRLEICPFSLRIESWAHQSPGPPIEYRYPLLDRALVEAVLQVPLEYVAGGYIWSDFVRKYLPSEFPEKRLKRDFARSAADSARAERFLLQRFQSPQEKRSPT